MPHERRLPLPLLPDHPVPRPSRRDWLVRLGALSVGGLTAQPMRAEALSAGGPAPALTLRTDAGESRLADHRGRVVWLGFWASWCAPCRESFPWLQAMHTRYSDQGLDIVALNLDARPEAARRFLAHTPVSFTIAWDPSRESARRFAVRAMPTSVLIGADGHVRAVQTGFPDGDRAPLEALLRAALAERDAERDAS